MKAFIALSTLTFILPITQAVDMTFYDPQCGVDDAFGPFYEALLRTNEDPASTSDFTDFFTPNGSLIVAGSAAVGAADILASRQAMLPVDGSVRWNHFPNITFVAAETATDKTFQLSGIMHGIAGGNCSTTYFSTRFTVTKNVTTNLPDLTPQSGSLITYDGFIVQGSDDPCFQKY